MNNKKTITNVVISIIASLSAPAATIYFAGASSSLLYILEISAVTGFLLAVVTFLVARFSSYLEQYSALLFFLTGFGLNVIVSTTIMILCITTLWKVVLGIMIVALIQAAFCILSKFLGSYFYTKRP